MNSFLKTTLVTTMVALVGMMVFYVYEPNVAEAGWYSVGGAWGYRKVITINNGKVEGASNLTDFPILIDITEADLATYAQSDGDDILFTSGDGTTKLDHEIELYTTATGRLTAWVRIPTLYAERDTTIYMYYGNSGASSQQNATGVWDSNYKGVWHLPNGTSLTANDSTSNANNGTISGAAAITGKINGGASFNGSTDKITIPNQASQNVQTGDFTSSTWFYINTQTSYAALFDKGASFNRNLAFFVNNSSSQYVGIGNSENSTSGSGWSAGSWHYLSMTRSGSSVTIYLNGSSNATFTNSGVTNSGYDLFLGYNNSGGGTSLNGRLDEFRISNSVRSADWIATEYNNQSATSTFYTIGTQETDTATANIPSVILRGQMILQGQMKI